MDNKNNQNLQNLYPLNLKANTWLYELILWRLKFKIMIANKADKDTTEWSKPYIYGKFGALGTVVWLYS